VTPQPTNTQEHTNTMSIDTSVADFLTGGGGRSAKFETIGDKIKGTVVAAETRQQIDMDTDKPAFWDDGKPKMQLVVTLQTGEREDDDDDGVRNLYVKGSKKPETQSLTASLIGALKAAKATSLEVGGILAVRYVGDGTASKRGFNPPKLYEMAYKAPALDTGDLLADAPTPAPVPPTAPAPATAASSDDLFDDL